MTDRWSDTNMRRQIQLFTINGETGKQTKLLLALCILPSNFSLHSFFVFCILHSTFWSFFPIGGLDCFLLGKKTNTLSRDILPMDQTPHQLPSLLGGNSNNSEKKKLSAGIVYSLNKVFKTKTKNLKQQSVLSLLQGWKQVILKILEWCWRSKRIHWQSRDSTLVRV